MQINNIQVVDRHARPAVLSKVALRTFFINDGEFVDPYAISSVSVYKKAANQAPSGIFETSSGQITSGHHSDALMVFSPSTATNPSGGPDTTALRESGSVVKTGGVVREAFKEREYKGELGTSIEEDSPANLASGVSGVYRLGLGEYAVVLDGGLSLSGVRHDGVESVNKASGTGDYIDVWTVKLTENSPWSTFINNFRLFSDTFYTLTEPLLLRTSNRLINKHVSLGSKIDLKISTEMTVENRNISQDTKNLMKEIGLNKAAIKIERVNEGSHLPSRVTVSSFAATSGLLDVTADNTLVHSWDTDDLSLNDNKSDMGGFVGTYYITAQYTILNQKIISSPMPIIVT